MKDKSGFTLIELLAIIVILGIIAVITVPKINDAVENSRRSAALDSAYGYVESVNKLFYSGLLNDYETDIPNGIYSYSDLLEMGLVISGNAPSPQSQVKIQDNEVVGYTLEYGKYVISCEEGKTPIVMKTSEDDSSRDKAIRQRAQSYLDAALQKNSSLTADTVKRVFEIRGISSNVPENGWVVFGYDALAENPVPTIKDYSLLYKINGDTYAVNYDNVFGRMLVTKNGSLKEKPSIVNSGTKVCLLENECFYVINTNDDTTVLLAEANLNVGGDRDSRLTVGMQGNSGTTYPVKMGSFWRDASGSLYKIYGTSYYDSDLNGDNYIYDGEAKDNEGNYLCTPALYINNYVALLKEQGVSPSITGRLMNMEEATSLRSDILNIDASYWIGVAKSAYNAFYIDNLGRIMDNYGFYNDVAGVRIVIEIPTDEL